MNQCQSFFISVYIKKIPKIRDFFYDVLYQIGIRCLGATQTHLFGTVLLLYQIGIRCLGATGRQQKFYPRILYQIGIRCLGATPIHHKYSHLHYIRLEFGV